MDVETPNEARDHLPFAQHHAFIIGIDAYQKVSPLQTAVADARRLAEVLGAQQHFLVHPPLLDANGSQVRALLESGLREQVGKDDRVFFYFAGHGIAVDGDDGPAGYIVPADADPTDVKTLIPMTDLQKALDSLPCRHLLLVLDCCFSGAFKWSSQYRTIGTLMPKRIYKERFDRFIEDAAWQVITSAAYDQKALDVVHGQATGARGLVKSDDAAAHSPFARALFEGLAGAGDARGDTGEGDGVITATELYAYIRDQVEPETIEEGQRLRQTPGFFPLKKHDKGEFIFLHPQHRLNLPPIPKRSPYKGLESFNEEDRLLFYGRDRVIKHLRLKAQECKLVVVSGASGTGKSSVIKAGLLPLLRAEGFRILPVIRPGAHPLAELERAIALAKDATPDAPKAILLIDQLEELITRCADPKEREAFDKRLQRLLDEDANIHRVILTVRSDFEPQLNSGALKAEWMKGRYTIPPFSLEELKEVIVMPTIQEVLIFDPPQLVDEITAEVVQAPGALPLLSYALSELYEAYRSSGRQDRALKKEDYDGLGGVVGALSKKVDGLFQAAQPADQSAMRKLMLRMVSVEGSVASRRVPVADLDYSAAENPRVQGMVEKLVDARLIVKGEDYVEPAHDALVRAWKRLYEWVHEIGNEALILGTKLGAAANEFAQSKDSEFLWNNNPHLPAVERELKNAAHWFNAREVDFIRKSVSRKKRRSRILWATTGTVGVVLAAAALVAWNSAARLNAQNARDSQLNDMATRELGAVLNADAVPGTISAQSPESAWRSLMQAQSFAMYLDHGKGRVVAVAHDGLLTAHQKEGAAFLRGSLKWLSNAETTRTVLVSSGHCEVVSHGAQFSALPADLIASWDYGRIESVSDLRSIAGRGKDAILIVGNIWGDNLSEDEIRAVERFVSGGGGLLAGGLGWSWVEHHAKDFNPCLWATDSKGKARAKGTLENDYPMNRLMKPFGLVWTQDAIGN